MPLKDTKIDVGPGKTGEEPRKRSFTEAEYKRQQKQVSSPDQSDRSFASSYLFPGMTNNDSVSRDMSKYTKESGEERVRSWAQSIESPIGTPLNQSSSHPRSDAVPEAIRPSGQLSSRPETALSPEQIGREKAEEFVAKERKRIEATDKELQRIMKEAKDVGRRLGGE